MKNTNSIKIRAAGIAILGVVMATSLAACTSLNGTYYGAGTDGTTPARIVVADQNITYELYMCHQWKATAKGAISHSNGEDTAVWTGSSPGPTADNEPTDQLVTSNNRLIVEDTPNRSKNSFDKTANDAQLIAARDQEDSGNC